MTTFDKREEGFEKQFAHDEELRFKANARRNKLLGAWAATQMGLNGADADAYAKEVVMADFEEAGDEDVFRKVRKDFDAKGVKQTDQQIRTTMTSLMAEAITLIKAGKYTTIGGCKADAAYKVFSRRGDCGWRETWKEAMTA